MIYSIQVLRGIAAFSVALIHAEALMYDYYGIDNMKAHASQIFDDARSGVDLFFIISGFVMTYNFQRKHISWTNFITGRIIRIVPLYWALTIFLFSLFYLFPQLFSSLKVTSEQLFYSLFFIPNKLSPVIGIGWTLNFEICFYIIFSLVFILPRNVGPNVVWSIILLAVLAGASLELNNPILRQITSPLLLEFLTGSIIARFWFRKEFTSNLSYLVAGLGLFLIVLPIPGGRVFDWGIGCSMLVFGCIMLPKENLMNSSKILILLGNISYSLYLVHDFALPAVGKLWFFLGLDSKFPMTFLPALALFVSIFCSSITYLLIEKYFTLFLKGKLSGSKPKSPKNAISTQPDY